MRQQGTASVGVFLQRSRLYDKIYYILSLFVSNRGCGMGKSSAKTIETKRNALATLIQQRQAFEAEQFKDCNDATAANKAIVDSPYTRYKTDLNFADRSGNTLLHFACLEGDLEAVKTYISQGADMNVASREYYGLSPIGIALNKGQLDLAQFLFEQGALCNQIELKYCEWACKSWFTEKLSAALHESYPKPGQRCISKPNQFFNDNSPEDSSVDLKCAIQLGDIDYVRAVIEKRKSWDGKPIKKNVYTILHDAAISGQLDLFKMAIDLGANINFPDGFSAPLHLALENGQDEIVDYCLAHGANILARDDAKKSPLYFAIESENTAYIEKLLEKGASISDKDNGGNTVFHHAAVQSSQDAMKCLLKQPGAVALVQEKNYFGQRPLDLAIQSKDDAMIDLLEPNPEAREAIKRSNAYGQVPTDIDQLSVYGSLNYFLHSQYRDSSLLSPTGNCNGYAYLYEYYASQQMEDYYFNTLALIATWDGTNAALNKPFTSEPQKKHGYTNLKDVMEQWINDIIWFQHSMLPQDISRLSQMQRAEQEQIIGIDAAHENITVYKSTSRIDEQDLREIVQYFQQMPVGCRFEFTINWGDRKGHAMSAHREKNELFAFYDSNNAQIMTKFNDVNQFVEQIMRYDSAALIVPRVFFFKKDAIPLDEVILFEENELPNSSEAVQAFQKNSANQFTPLHLALIFRNKPLIERLLKDGFCDINAKDKHERTALDIAIESGYREGMDLLLNNPNIKKSRLIYHLKRAIEENDPPFIEQLLGGNKVDLKVLENGQSLLNFIISGFPDRFPLIVDKIADINQLDDAGNATIHYASRALNKEILTDLIARGAKLDQVNTKDETAISIIENNKDDSLKQWLHDILKSHQPTREKQPISSAHLLATHNIFNKPASHERDENDIKPSDNLSKPK